MNAGASFIIKKNTWKEMTSFVPHQSLQGRVSKRGLCP